MANRYIYDLVATWNNNSTTYNGIKLNVTDSTSAANSNLLHLLLNSNSIFRIKKDGTVFTKNLSVNGNITATGNLVVNNISVNGTLSFSSNSNVGLVLNQLSNSQVNSLSSPTQGSLVYNTTSNTVQVYDGTSWADVSSGGISVGGSNGQIQYNDNGTFGGIDGIFIVNDRINGISVTKSYTNSEVYETLDIYFAGNTGVIRTTGSGGGSNNTLPLNITAGNTGGGLLNLYGTPIKIFNGITEIVNIDNGIIFPTDNTFDIGASGATRPRNVYVAGTITSSTLSATTTNSTYFNFNSSRGYIEAQADGVFSLFNAAGNSFSRLQFGGTTSSFPAIKRNSTGLDIRLADDSAYAPLTIRDITITGNISASAWTTSGIKLKSSAATLTDTSSSGTVASAYTNFLGGDTIAASSSTTYTNYYSTYISEATAGTNVTLSNRWALGLTGALRAYTVSGYTGNVFEVGNGSTRLIDISYQGLISGQNNWRIDIGGQGDSTSFYKNSNIYFNIQSSSIRTAANLPLGWSSTNDAAWQTFDTGFYRDGAAGVIAQRNSTSAQAFRVYNTYTDSSNYERHSTIWSSNVLYLKNENAGTGSARLMIPVTGSSNVGSLPAATTAGVGARAFVTDATATTFLSTVSGGGSNKVPVVSDGTNWLIG